MATHIRVAATIALHSGPVPRSGHHVDAVSVLVATGASAGYRAQSCLACKGKLNEWSSNLWCCQATWSKAYTERFQNSGYERESMTTSMPLVSTENPHHTRHTRYGIVATRYHHRLSPTPEIFKTWIRGCKLLREVGNHAQRPLTDVVGGQR